MQRTIITRNPNGLPNGLLAANPTIVEAGKYANELIALNLEDLALKYHRLEQNDDGFSTLIETGVDHEFIDRDVFPFIMRQLAGNLNQRRAPDTAKVEFVEKTLPRSEGASPTFATKFGVDGGQVKQAIDKAEQTDYEAVARNFQCVSGGQHEGTDEHGNECGYDIHDPECPHPEAESYRAEPPYEARPPFNKEVLKQAHEAGLSRNETHAVTRENGLGFTDARARTIKPSLEKLAAAEKYKLLKYTGYIFVALPIPALSLFNMGNYWRGNKPLVNIANAQTMAEKPSRVTGMRTVGLEALENFYDTDRVIEQVEHALRYNELGFKDTLIVVAVEVEGTTKQDAREVVNRAREKLVKHIEAKKVDNVRAVLGAMVEPVSLFDLFPYRYSLKPE